MMTKSVAVLGCGPAGLLVAHAAEISGWDFRIYSRKEKSRLYGAQYLHKPIPGISNGPTMVDYKLNGTPQQYRRKVYGPEWDGTVSPEDFTEPHYAWDIRSAYDQLWRKYEGEIHELKLPEQLYLADNTYQADLVISTVPRKIWAMHGDVFESQKIWALGDTEMPRVDPAYRPAPFTVQCDGTPQTAWYRVSNIFGYCTVEWPWRPYYSSDNEPPWDIPPTYGASVVEKPLRHNSTAANDFVHLGRYGKWEKGVLTSDAFYDAMKVFAQDSIEGVSGA